MLNKITLIGNVGKDPEIKSTPSGGKISKFSIATSESYNDKQGEKITKTEWHNVVVFNPNLAEIVEKYVRKGSKLYVEGQIQTRRWNDNAGQERSTIEVVLANFRGEIKLLDSKAGEIPF